MKLFKNKIVVVITIIMIIIIVSLLLVFKILFGGNGSGVYGNRLKGIEKVEISNKTEETVIKEVGGVAEVEDVTYKLQGKIVNVIITLKDEPSLDRGKEIANKVLGYFDENQLAYYDFQIFLTSTNEKSEIYPKIGYKHNTSEGLVWKQE